ncbi:efflux RND transporter periplasmic adaptor subunit [Thalassospira marina]|uniref:Efflux transporter periplasmic adaptor subunit n=1 Tax=Thalassospira marina TaxID=2048283 RepID=A0A2N3KJI3_9PROT|nr:efflux RND transporter periplasmic adaptor subunit [Thalassospira marina]PKR50737.1 efflux transporter periplasmic adaptor subunit [Thalassospira marina]
MSSKSKLRYAVGAVAIALVAAGVAGVVPVPFIHAEEQQEAPAPAQAPKPVPATVAEIHNQNITRWSSFSGRLEAIDRVEIRPRVAGAIESVHFREGDLVKQGDLLFTLDPAPFETEVARAEAAVFSAQSRLKLATTELDRGNELWKTRVITRTVLDQRQETKQNAEADLRSAQAQLRSAKLNLGYTEIRAPISGRVGDIRLTPGNLVAAGANSEILTTLVSVDPIYATFDVNEQALLLAMHQNGEPSVDAVQQIPVQLSSDFIGPDVIKGHVQMIDNEFNPRSGTIRVQAVFDNTRGRLVPGQFARLELGQASAGKAIMVAERAVGTDQDKKFVLVVNPQNVVEYREIRVGGEQDGLRIVTSGLEEGERIVVEGLQHIRPGMTVAPEVVSMDRRSMVDAGDEAKGDSRS